MDESGASHESGTLREHSTTRANNIYLIDEEHEYGKTLMSSGSAIKDIREESRCIWMVNGTPGIFFDLDKSQTFQKICQLKYDFKVENFLFMPGELSLKCNDDLVQTIRKEQVIEESIVEFHEFVIKNVTKSDSDRSISWSPGAHPLPESKQYLESLYQLVHKDEFIIQQNRDLYREICQHVCAEMLDSEHATYIRTKLYQDLNKALDADDFGMTHGINEQILADVMTQLFSNLRAHETLQTVRKYNKEYRKFARGEVQKAREKLRLATKNVWRANQGDNEIIVQKRKTILKNLQIEYNAQTDWEYLKMQFNLYRSQAYDKSEQFQTSRNERNKHIHEYTERKKDEERERQKSVKEIEESYEKNARENEQQIEKDKLQKKKEMEFARKNVVPTYRPTDKGSFDNRYTPFAGYLKKKYTDQIMDKTMQRKLANDCETPCVKELIYFLNDPLSVHSIGEYVRKSLQNMHEKIYNEMLQGRLDVSEEDQEYIKSYFDSRVYEHINRFEFQETDATKRGSKIQKIKLILDEFHIIMKNLMDKHDELVNNITFFSNLHYNPYVI